jgi:hypothetical protein
VRVTRVDAVQVHPFPNKVESPKGPFPREMFFEPEIVSDYEPQFNEDGYGFEMGATAQNNFKSPRVLRCGSCLARVKENETEAHVCED